MSKKNIILFSFTVLFLGVSFHPAGKTEYKIKTIVIDAGHGGKDPGTSGTFSKEKDVALKIALELGETIQKNIPDIKVIYTRKGDVFPALDERAFVANKNNADLFISIHCNSSPSKTIYGSETYVIGMHKTEDNLKVAQRENAAILIEENTTDRYEGFDPNAPESYILFSMYQNAFQNNSLMLAQKIEEQFKTRVGRHSRGVKQAGFLVLWKTAMPSVLVEVGYLSNAKEEKELNDALNQSYIASGIFRAFRDYKEEIESNP